MIHPESGSSLEVGNQIQHWLVTPLPGGIYSLPCAFSLGSEIGLKLDIESLIFQASQLKSF